MEIYLLWQKLITAEGVNIWQFLLVFFTFYCSQNYNGVFGAKASTEIEIDNRCR